MTVDNFISEMETLLAKYKKLDYYEIEKVENIIRQMKIRYTKAYWENHCC
jgi:hypothetical protein